MNNKFVIIGLCFLPFLLSAHNFNLITIQDLLKKDSNIEYIQCHDKEDFEYIPFPISRFPELQPNKGRRFK